MLGGFKVSQNLRNKKLQKQAESHNSGNAKQSNGSGHVNLRFSLKQYEELIMHIWRHNLDPEGKHEAAEGKFFRLLRENKILSEKKQIDEMFKQCIFAKKGEEVTIDATIQLS